MIDLDDAAKSNPEITSPKNLSKLRRRRWFLLAITLAVVVTVGLFGLRPSTGPSDQELRSKGFTPLATVQGTNIWVDSKDSGDAGVITNGRLGVLCNSGGGIIDYLPCSPTSRDADVDLAVAYLQGEAREAQVVSSNGRAVDLKIVKSPAGIGPAGTRWGYALVSPPMDDDTAPTLTVNGQKVMPTGITP